MVSGYYMDSIGLKFRYLFLFFWVFVMICKFYVERIFLVVVNKVKFWVVSIWYVVVVVFVVCYDVI